MAPPAAPPVGTPPASVHSRLPGNRDAWIVGGIITAGGGLALLQRHRANKAKGAAANTTATAPSDATYDTSVMDAYNQLQEEYDQLAEKVQGLGLPTSTGTKGPPPPVPTPVKKPPVKGPPAPPPGPHPPVKVPPPKPTPKPPAPPPKPTQRTVTVGHWPNWDGSLFGIAQHEYGNGNQWQKIYAANKAKIGNDPNKIQPGTVLVIP